MKIMPRRIVLLGLATPLATLMLTVGMSHGANAGVPISIKAPATAAIDAATCYAWGFLGECTTSAIPASSGHRIYYNIASCGWGNIYDIDTHQLVGSTLLGPGFISGLYGRYTLTVRNVVPGVIACLGGITN
jgi:hypothetical protein